MEAKPQPKPRRYKEQRIIGGYLHNVITERNKIVEDLGLVKKDQPLEEQKSQIANGDVDNSGILEEQNSTIGLQLIAKEDIKKSGVRSTKKDKLIEIPNENEAINGTEQPQISENVSTEQPIVSTEQSPIAENVPTEQPPIVPAEQPPIEHKPLNIKLTSIPVAELVPVEPDKNVPVSEPVPQLPKLQINVPSKKKEPKYIPTQFKDVNNMPIPGVPTRTITTSDSYQSINKVVGPNLQKAVEDNIVQQPKTNKDKSKPKERRRMEDGLEAELLDERKFEEWIKKQKFRENLEKAARFAEETKQQFEEKIPELSNKIEGITGEVKGVENRLGAVDKSVGDLCTGVDCIKDDVKKYKDEVAKYQDNISKYQDSQAALEKLVQQRFEELGNKVEGLERVTLTCENCGEDVISPLSSYCPNCGAPIHSWSDPDGQPVKGWVPYWKKLGREVP